MLFCGNKLLLGQELSTGEGGPRQQPCSCTHAPDILSFMLFPDTQELILHVSCHAELEHAPPKVSKLGQEGLLLGDTSPVLYETQSTVDAASGFPGPGTGVWILLLNQSPHSNTTK